MERQNISSEAPWESAVGYSRAVQVGPHVHVAGTIATDECGELIETTDPYEQTVQAIQNVQNALRGAGASLNDVVRTRLYVTEVSQWEQVGKAHAEFFGQIRPATSMIEVSKLVEPEALVEIEAQAILSTSAAS